MKREGNNNLYLWAVCLLFFFSGLSALIFENVWQRMMILVFGASASSTTAILSALFLGIALGSWVGGRLLDRFKNALSFYAFVELLIAVTGMLVPVFLSIVDHLYLFLFKTFEFAPALSFGFRFFMAILAILPATMGMGATIPIMSRILSRQGKTIGGSVALAYGLNIFGAVVGCLLAGFFLVPAFGAQSTLLFAMSISMLVALGVFLLRGYWGDETLEAEEDVVVLKSGLSSRSLLSCYVLAGFIALAFEIVWMRILAIYNTNSVMTFTLGLSVYLAGFSLGSLWLYKLLSKRMSGMTVFRVGGFCVAAFAMAMVPCVRWYSETVHNLPYILAGQGMLTVTRLFVIELGYALILMFIPAVFMGLSFPAVCQVLIEKRGAVAVKSGTFYSLGNIGSMLGVLVTGLILIPLIGLVKVFGLLCCLSVVMVIVLALIDSNIGSRVRWLLASGVLLTLSVWYAVTGLPYTSFGRLSRVDGRLMEDDITSNVEILRYASGASGTIAIRETPSGGKNKVYREVYVDDNRVASTHFDQLTDAKMLAHVPLMLHPDPKKALTVGFGSGGTSWSMTRYGIDIDVVEIEKEVINSAYLFESQNHGVLREPNFNVILNDARDLLRVTSDRYDVISTDVTSLRYKQNGNLYSREYFELMKSRLTDDGIACAWVPLIAITEDELKMLIRTFQEVYPYSSFWYIDYARTAYTLFIGTPAPVKIDINRVASVMGTPGIAEDLKMIGITHPYHFVNLLYLDADGMRSYAGDGILHTDDRPVLESSSAISYFSGGAEFKTIMDDIMNLRPFDLSPYVVNLEKEKVKDLAAFMVFSRKWAEVVRALFGDVTRSRTEMITLLEEILDIMPNHQGAKNMLKAMRAGP